MTPAGAPERFVVLDSLRGICALCVAWFHLSAVTSVTFAPFVRHAWLFVDFFFVLSGFVIARAYGAKLASGHGVRDFMLLRLGRIYPLHLAMLLLMLGYEVFSIFLFEQGLVHRAPFSATTVPGAFFGSLGLVHIFGLWPGVVWNGPSWSIAAEMWAYLVFALVCASLRSHWVAAMTALALAALAWMAIDGTPLDERTSAGSLPRCLAGFGLGVLASHLRPQAWLQRLRGPGASFAEALALAGTIAFVLLAQGPLVLAAPVLFLAVVLVFSAEGGLVSRLLATAPFVRLGLLSYSIYMVHIFVIRRMGDAYVVVQKLSGIRMVEPCSFMPARQCFAAGPVPLFSEGLFLGAVIGVSWLAWRTIEEPGRKWSRRRVGRAKGQSSAAMAIPVAT